MRKTTKTKKRVLVNMKLIANGGKVTITRNTQVIILSLLLVV